MRSHHPSAIAITGVGVSSPLGNGFAEMSRALQRNQTGIRPLTRFPVGSYRCRVAGETPDLGLVAPRGDLLHEYKRMDRFVHLAISAGCEALGDADTDKVNTKKGILALGVGMGGLPRIEAGVRQNLQQAPRATSPYLIPSLIPNMAACFLARALRWEGCLQTYASACAGGLVALGEAIEAMRSGRVDWALAGGVEAVITPITWSGLEAMRALTPRDSAIPFAQNRDGMVVGEAAILFVLEPVVTALRRGVKIRGILYPPSIVVYPEAFVSPDQNAMRQAMEKALIRAGVGAPVAVIAQASGMRLGDEIEAAALAELLDGAPAAVTSIKGHTGHTFAASGPLNIAVALQAMYSGILPAIFGLDRAEPIPATLRFQRSPTSWQPGPVLVTAFGFGGIHGAAVVSHFNN